ELPRAVPDFAGRFRAERCREASQVSCDLVRHQPAMLKAAFIRLAFDVQHDPAGLRKAIRRPVALHRRRIRLEVRARRILSASRGRREQWRSTAQYEDGTLQHGMNSGGELMIASRRLLSGDHSGVPSEKLLFTKMRLRWRSTQAGDEWLALAPSGMGRVH